MVKHMVSLLCLSTATLRPGPWRNSPFGTVALITLFGNLDVLTSHTVPIVPLVKRIQPCVEQDQILKEYYSHGVGDDNSFTNSMNNHRCAYQVSDSPVNNNNLGSKA